MILAEIAREGIESCYQAGLVKPNEFRQIVQNLIEKEVSLRLDSMTNRQKLDMFFTELAGGDWILQQYQEYSYSQEGLTECILSIVGYNSDLLLLSPEDSKLLFLSNVFHKKSLLVRDCSDVLNNSYVTEDKIFVDKETLRAIEYLCKHTRGGKAVLKTLEETK